jgi:hypothetical protein
MRRVGRHLILILSLIFGAGCDVGVGGVVRACVGMLGEAGLGCTGTTACATVGLAPGRVPHGTVRYGTQHPSPCPPPVFNENIY